LVLQVQELLGPDSPARDEESLLISGYGQGMDDAGVDPGHLPGPQLSLGHRYPGGDVDEQLPGLVCEPDCSDQLWVIRVVVGQGQH
jgi:hypothetical protein